jgi:hypothetical protein
MRCPAAPRGRPSRARILSRSTSLRHRYSPKPAIAHQASPSRQTRPAAKEQLLRSASILQHHVHPPEPHDAHHGFRRRDDARHALYNGENIVDILSFSILSFFPSFLMWLLILRHRKIWTPEYCRKHSRTKRGLRMLCRAVI